MTALWILCGIVALVCLILLIPIGIELRYDGEITLSARTAFLRFRLIPKRRKKIRLRNFSKKRYEKMLAKEKEKAEKKRKTRSVRTSQHKEAEQKRDGGEKKTTLAADLWELRDIMLDIFGDFVRKIRTDRLKIHLTVGASDAASCALLYGAASQFTAYALELVRSQTRISCREDVAVTADFASEETYADIELCFRVHVGNVLASVFRLGIEYFKKMIKEN